MRNKYLATFLISFQATLLLFLKVGTAYAFGFDDTENSTGNVIGTTTLDMELDLNGQSNFEPEENIYPGDSVTRTVYVENVGELDFEVGQWYEFVSGNTDLCNELDLDVTHEGNTVYSGKLSSYSLNMSGGNSNFVIASGGNQEFYFEVSLPGDANPDLSDVSCVFDIHSKGWQHELSSSLGFWDIESFESVVNSGDWKPPEAPENIHIINHKDIDIGCGGITNDRFITIDWDDSPESDFDHYEYQIREGTTIAYPIVSEFSGNIRDVDDLYKYRVRALDHNSNASEWTPWCEVTLDRSVNDYDTRDVVINEIMWMGSDLSSNDEWIELYNNTSSDIDLGNWTIDGLTIPNGYEIPANGYFLIANYDESDSNSALDVAVDWETSDVSLDNGGEELVLLDALMNIIDEYGGGSWPEGEDGSEKRSMERNKDPTTGWHTCIDNSCNDTTYWDTEGDNYGTPGDENLSENDPSDYWYEVHPKAQFPDDWIPSKKLPPEEEITIINVELDPNPVGVVFEGSLIVNPNLPLLEEVPESTSSE